VSQPKTEIVISAVDRATATIEKIAARLDAATLPAHRLAGAFGNLYQATGLGAVQKAVSGVTSSLVGLATASVGIAGVYSGTIGSIMAFALHSADAADKIGDLSERYHIATKDLQVYGSMMEEAGVGSVEDAASSLGKLQKAMNEAMNGGKDQAAAFAGVGISLENLKNMKPDQVIASIADAFKGSDRDLEKNAVLLELMGKSGSAWMSIMDKGGAEIRARYEQMVADGRILSSEQIEQADRYDKAWRRMTGTLDGVKTALGLQLAEKLQPMIENIQKWIVANRELIAQKFDKFLERLPKILEVAQELFVGLWTVVQQIAGAFKAVSSVLGPTMTGFLAVAVVLSPLILSAGQLAFGLGKVAWILGNLTGIIPTVTALARIFFNVLIANPIGLLVTAIVGLAVIVYQNWDGIVAYVSAAWERIKAVFGTGFFSGLIQLWLEQWQALGNGILGIIKSVLPESWMPKALKDLNFTVATDRAARLTAEGAAKGASQDIKNTLSIKIDAEGRAKVTEMSSDSPSTAIDVSAGYTMVGA